MFTLIPLMTISIIACGDKNTDTGTLYTGIDEEVPDTQESDTDEVAVEDLVLEEELKHPLGCADFHFIDRNNNDSISLDIRGIGLAQQAHAEGEVQHVEVDLSEDETDYPIIINIGQDLTHTFCGDMIDPNKETIIEQSFIPVNGTLNLTVTAEESQGQGDISAIIEVQIQVAEFCADNGDGSTNPDICLSISDYSASTSIGWFHG